MRPGRWSVTAAVAGIAIVWLLPLSPALSDNDILAARLIGAGLTAAICAVFAMSKRGSPFLWTTIAIVSAAVGLALMLAHVSANGACVADYDGRAILIGRDYTPSAAEYVSRHPGSSAADLLLDAGGVPARIWTQSSISSCRFWTGWGGVLSIALFAGAVCALVERRAFRYASAAATPSKGSSSLPERPAVYDAFLSYRHTEPDKSNALEVLESLESRGLRVAVDFRDFAPNQHFLSEMERCIKESRFVLCVVTSRYLDSDHCSEEAIISKTLDMADRKKRLVPLIFERTTLPVWLHGIVGIDFTEAANVDPMERLLRLLAPPR